MISRGLRSEIRWLMAVLVAALIVGYALQAIFVCLSFTLLALILWYLRRFAALEAWVAKARQQTLPADDFGGVCGDIADDVRRLRRRYERDKVRLQKVVTRVEDMTSALSDGVVLVDKRGNIEWWNRAAQSIIHFQDIDLRHPLTNIIRHPRFIAYFDSDDYRMPLKMLSPRNERQHLEFHIHRFGSGDRLVILRDITRMMHLEKMRKDFVSNVSHELRTPLTVIKGYLETLIDSSGHDHLWASALTQMQQQSHRMAAIVQDLLALTRLETDETQRQPQHVDLHQLLTNIIADAQALADTREDRAPEFILCGSEGIGLSGNEEELRSAFSNLIFNAVKYSPAGGTITITATLTSEGGSVSVSDQGLGIDAQHLPRITERFYRVDDGRSRALGGTGLGLAIVKHAMMRHDAELTIRSVLGQGSTFLCQFPADRMLKYCDP